MAKARSRHGLLTFIVRLIVLAIVTAVLVNIGKRQLDKVASSDEFPTTKQQYEQAVSEQGQTAALKAVLDPDAAGSSAVSPVNHPEPEKATLVLKSDAVAAAAEAPEEQPETEIIEFSEPLFRGKLIKVKDPSRVYTAVSGPLGTPTSAGKPIPTMIEEHGAIAAVNANGFVDPNGMGNGGLPVGIVISDGKLCFGDLNTSYDLCGIDKDGKLHCEWLTGQEALDMGIRDAACFGPSLIHNGEKRSMAGMYTGLNARTVIGQAADGTMMLLLIEGRLFTSIGINYEDLVDFCYDLGMVEASNMDGGASSVMYYGGEQVTIVSTLYGARNTPNCWLVAPEK